MLMKSTIEGLNMYEDEKVGLTKSLRLAALILFWYLIITGEGLEGEGVGVPQFGVDA